MDEQALHEVYARHFQMMIQDAGVACIMASYNKVNGTNATQNGHLLNDFCVPSSDSRGSSSPTGGRCPEVRTTRSIRPSARQLRQAPSRRGWTWSSRGLSTIRSSKPSSEVPSPKRDINTAVSRILEQKFRFKVDKTSGAIGLKSSTSTFSGGSINSPAHIELAAEAAQKSMVLLKNETNTLPIDKTKVKSIAVIGASLGFHVTSPDINGTIDFAADPRTGDLGSSRVNADASKSVGPFDGIKAAAGSGITVTKGNTAAAAANADFVVVVAGLTPEDEGEEYTGAGDRTSLSLDGKKGGKTQNDLITAVAALKKPMVVVLEGGAPIDMPWLSQVPAVVMAWYPGMVGGTALGKLLMGDANFSGKLPVTWPAAVADFPTFNGGGTTMMDYYLGYRYFDKNAKKALFPFGFGLSYTKFTYANLVVPCSTVSKKGSSTCRSRSPTAAPSKVTRWRFSSSRTPVPRRPVR